MRVQCVMRAMGFVGKENHSTIENMFTICAQNKNQTIDSWC